MRKRSVHPLGSVLSNGNINTLRTLAGFHLRNIQLADSKRTPCIVLSILQHKACDCQAVGLHTRCICKLS
jgi:hypothetical protein